MSGRYGDKGVIAAIIPDDQMPHDKDGKPFEALLNPLGIVTRTNPAQIVEAMLGKIAAKTGQPIKVPDFEDEADMTAWAKRQLAQHQLSDLEDVIDPEYGHKVTGVATGNRFFMKLHHTAESKGQGRGSGAYSTDETPAKGGESGCFVGDTQVACVGPQGNQLPTNIDLLHWIKCPANVLTRDPRNGFAKIVGLVTDWFEYFALPSELVTVELENGARVTCTRTHEFVLADGNRRLAGNLKPGDDLMEV